MYIVDKSLPEYVDICYNNTMDKLSERIRLYKLHVENKERLRSERDEMIKNFLERINNEDRRQYFNKQNRKYTDLPVGALINMIKRRFGSSKTSIMREFYLDCQKASDFNKYFWWKLKEKPNQQLL